MPSKSAALSTIIKAVEILRLFSQDTPSLKGSMIAERAGLPKSTAYKYIQTLEGVGFLVRDMSGRLFRLGPRLIEFASIAHNSAELLDVSYSVLRNLVDQTNETAVLTGLIGNEVICLAKVESTQRLKVTYQVGATYPLHTGASALVLLACLPKQKRERIVSSLALTRFTEETVTSKEQLSLRLDRIRKGSFAVSRGEFDKDIFAVAAPIFSPSKEILASLAVGGPVQRLSFASEKKLISYVKKGANEVTRLLDQNHH